MGQNYTVNIDIFGFEKEDLAVMALNQLIKKHTDEGTADFGIEEKGLKDETDSFEGLMKIFLGYDTKKNYSAWSRLEVKGTNRVMISNDFKGTYGWEEIVVDMFTKIAPFVKDGSNMYMSMDEGDRFFTVTKGKAEEVEVSEAYNY